LLLNNDFSNEFLAFEAYLQTDRAKAIFKAHMDERQRLFDEENKRKKSSSAESTDVDERQCKRRRSTDVDERQCKRRRSTDVDERQCKRRRSFDPLVEVCNKQKLNTVTNKRQRLNEHQHQDNG